MPRRAGALLGAALAVGLIACSGGGDEDAATATADGVASSGPLTTSIATTLPVTSSDPTTTVVSVVTTAAPATTAAPNATGAGVIGETMLLQDGSLARVDSVIADAPLREGVEVDPGAVHAVTDVELCAGPEGHTMDPFSWVLVLADGTVLTPDDPPYGLVYDGLAPGTCARGPVSFSLPQGATIAAAGYEDLADTVVLWASTVSVAVAGPLAPPVVPVTVPVGQPVTLPDGATVVVRSATVNAPLPYPQVPLPAGWQLVALDVEVCGGAEPLDTEDFSVLGADNQAGTRTLSQYGTMPESEAPPGACVAGTVMVDFPASSMPRYVSYGLGERPPVWEL